MAATCDAGNVGAVELGAIGALCASAALAAALSGSAVVFFKILRLPYSNEAVAPPTRLSVDALPNHLTCRRICGPARVTKQQ